MFGVGEIGTIVFTLVIIVVSLVVTIVPAALIIWKVVLPIMKRSQEQAALLQTGMAAQARVLQLGDTGTLINNQPQVQMVLEVHPPGGMPYQTQVVTVISQLAIPRAQPGMWIQVRYDPTNPHKVAVAL